MADYTEQLNQERENGQGAESPERDERPSRPVSEITAAEWLMVGAVAVLADILGPVGFILLPILLLWHTIRFQRFPFKKLLGSGAFEVISVGLLPGWTGFIIWTFLEQKGYLPGWLGRLARGTSRV